MMILAAVTIEFGEGQVERTKLEDLKTTMLLIKGRAQIIADKESFGENYDSAGMVILTEATGYDLSLVQDSLDKLEDKNKISTIDDLLRNNL
jgi:hypothetical protein